MEQILTLPLELQLGLGGGFLAYMIAATGLRRGHTAIDVFMRSLAFGLPGILLAHLMAAETALGQFWIGLAAITLSVAIGAAWRKYLRGCWGALLKLADIHRDDGLMSAWDTMMESRDFNVTQVCVRLKSGRECVMEGPTPYLDGPMKGLIIGTDGDIVMVVDREVLPDGTEEVRTHQVVPGWGTRLTCIPAAEIETVELRCQSRQVSAGEEASLEAQPVSQEVAANRE